jgi:signal transduction histidine kinase
MQNIRSILVFGFVFGSVFSLVAYMTEFYIDHLLLILIPFLVAILCGLGVFVATGTSYILKGKTSERVASIIGFLTATAVNVLLVFSLLAYFGFASIQQEVMIGGLLGISVGATYGVYRYRIEKINERMAFLEELSDKNKKLQEATRKLVLTEERNRLGRDLHDSVSQGLHGLVFAIHSLKNELPEPTTRVLEIIKHMEVTANATLDELRTMIGELKPSLLAEEGLKEALEVTINLFSQRSKIPVEVTVNLPDIIDPEVEMGIYRIVQEALANVEKHANANQVSMKLSSADDQLVLTIRDDGRGFIRKKITTGNGLENMRRRVEELAGVSTIISKPGIGTTVIAKFPQKG